MDEFADFRQLQKNPREARVEIQTDADEESRDPASFIVADPDGNPVLIDQHA